MDIIQFLDKWGLLIVSSISIIIAARALYLTRDELKIQRNHNYLSVRPIPMITKIKQKGEISITLINAGLGPLIGIDLSYKLKKHHEKRLRDFFIPEELKGLKCITWSHEKEFTIPIGGKEILLNITKDKTNELTNKEFVSIANKILLKLSKITGKLVYTDIYESERKEKIIDFIFIEQYIVDFDLKKSRKI